MTVPFNAKQKSDFNTQLMAEIEAGNVDRAVEMILQLPSRDEQLGALARLALALARSLARARELAVALDHDRARARDLLLDRTRALALDRALGLARALALELARALDLDLARALARAFALDGALTRALARALDRDDYPLHSILINKTIIGCLSELSDKDKVKNTAQSKIDRQ
jgi:hypothetical protein